MGMTGFQGDDCQGGKVAIQVFDEFADAVCASWLEHVCLTTLEQERERVAQQVSLVIADDETVRLLNSEYRGINKTTDVLSFAFDNEGEYFGEGAAPSGWSADEEFVLPPGESAWLGEVIVSYPQAARQAQGAGHSVERELAQLIMHGILHLLGYDHMDDDEEREMNATERMALERLAESDDEARNG